MKLFFLSMIVIIISNVITTQDKTFLDRIHSDNILSYSHSDSSNSNSDSSVQPIRCFWLETKNMTVFDLKNLKRPYLQK
jgi:hypothetical protein